MCIVKWPVISCPRFCCEVVCLVEKDLVCLSELSLIPMLHQSEQSACRLPYSMAQFTPGGLVDFYDGGDNVHI